jgi:cobalt-zinc-cadmium efflux system protein
VLQLVVAGQTGSLAMLSDAFHNLSDVGAALVALQCERLARAPTPDGYPFGLRRYQVRRHDSMVTPTACVCVCRAPLLRHS